MTFEEGLNAGRERNHPSFGQLAVRPAFAVDHQAVVLPVEIILGEVGEFRNSEACIQERPDNQFLFMGLTGIGQPIGFILGEGFPLVLVAHTPSIAKILF